MGSSQSDQFRKILVVEGDPPTRYVLRNYLARYYKVDVAENASEGLACLERNDDYSAVIVGMALPPTGIDFVARVRRENPHLRIALLTVHEYEEHFSALRRHEIHTVIVKASPFDFDELLVAVENMVHPLRSLGLQRYLRDPLQVRDHRVGSLAEKQKMMEEAIGFFRRYRPHETDINQIRLAFEELINNAIYHAFRKSSGVEKYRMGTFETLNQGEEIYVEFGFDKRFLGCSVTDNQGTLEIETVMKKMERQITLEGLMDESGRGIYLTRTLCDRMIINLRPGVLTQVVLLFSHRLSSRIRPLYVNVIPG
jgi:anti-sigma regulatory factor (Ser/Thr protein kinase)/ActR/RegA family two-component response regulator